MQISGTGITTFNAKIKPDFQVKTTYALNWFPLSNGNMAASDLGAASDQYDCNIRLYKDENTLMSFANQIESNRVAGSNTIQLSGFNTEEHVFGADIDYSGTLNATMDMDQRTQGTLKGFGQTLRLSLLSPSFVGGSGFLPKFRFLDIGYKADSSYTINKYDSIGRNFYYQEHKVDSGKFTGTYTFTNEEMIGLRRYIATQRAAAISMPTIIGVTHPFGRRTNSTYVKITEFEDQGMYGLDKGMPRWRAKITMAEAF